MSLPVDRHALVLVADESIGRPLIARLRAEGFTMLAIEDLAPSADDAVVLDIAARAGALLITEDKDFGDLVYQRHLPLGAGVALLRLQGMATADKCDRAAQVFGERTGDLRGAFTVVTVNAVRVRPMS